MFDHIGIVVADLARAGRFYTACLAPLGHRLLADFSEPSGDGRYVYGRGEPADPFFVVARGRPSFWRTEHIAAGAPDHLAFQATSREAVDAFHRAGLANGGRDNGAPGPRRSSTPYYAAFLIDPDGNNVEAGYRGP
jgi:catechol 2,3-dioxygenase-like lactoylglutathione lyase family enzyme